MSDSIIAMWGKSFRSGKQPSSAATSSSLQVHCSVKAEAVGQILRESGHNAIWVTPKTSEGKPNDAWKMLWLASGVSLMEARMQAAKLSQACGLAKSGSKFAIRVAKADFETCWKLVFPNTVPPEDIATDHLVKIENLPFGTTAELLSQWATHQGWRLKPIRAMGPRAWLAGSPQAPPAANLSFNGAPILTREIKSKQAMYRDPILAGPKPSHRSGDQTAAQEGPQPLLGDPWARYSGPKPAVSAVNAGVSAVAGPNDQRFQAQDDRMKKLEDALITCQKTQDQTQQEITHMRNDIHKREHQMVAHVDKKLTELRSEIDSGFSRALNKQAEQFDSSIQELKQILIQQNTKRKNPEEEDAAM